MGYDIRAPYWNAATALAADDTFADRRRAIVLDSAARVTQFADVLERPWLMFDLGMTNSITILAVLTALDRAWRAALPRDRGDPLALVNRDLLSQQPYGVGTDRKYDMALITLCGIARSELAAYLSPAARAHLNDRLLSQYGPVDRKQLKVTYAGLVSVPET